MWIWNQVYNNEVNNSNGIGDYVTPDVSKNNATIQGFLIKTVSSGSLIMKNEILIQKVSSDNFYCAAEIQVNIRNKGNQKNFAIPFNFCAGTNINHTQNPYIVQCSFDFGIPKYRQIHYIQNKKAKSYHFKVLKNDKNRPVLYSGAEKFMERKLN